jgi:hypothetical protein
MEFVPVHRSITRAAAELPTPTPEATAQPAVTRTRRIGRILTHPSCTGSVLATHGLLVRDPAPYLAQLAHEVDRAPTPASGLHHPGRGKPKLQLRAWLRNLEADRSEITEFLERSEGSSPGLAFALRCSVRVKPLPQREGP